MYPPPSPRFLDALVHSHTVATEVKLIMTNGQTMILPHSGGSVTVDRSQAARRTCSVTLPDPTLIPRTPSDALNVYGARLRISRGIIYGDGTTELVPVGMFRVENVSGDVDLGPVTVTGSSFEAYLVDDSFRTSVTAPSTLTAFAAIDMLITQTLPNATVLLNGSDGPIGTTTWDAQDSRWTAIQTLATAIGCEVYADADGDFIVAPLPAVVASSVVWEVAASEGGALITPIRGMSRPAANSITASGDNTTDNTPPVSATVEDTDPTSPTYVLGPFGRVTGFYSSSTLTTTGACVSAATAQLAAQRKPNTTADLTALPNPLLEPGDVIRVVYADGTRELHQVASFPLGLDTTTAMDIATISAQEDS